MSARKAPIMAAYILTVGEVYYIGSSANIEKRALDHRWRLRRGDHPNPRLQEAFNATQHFQLDIKDRVWIRANCRTHLWKAEQALLDQHRGDPNLANRSMNARGPENGYLKAAWADPEKRAEMLTRLREMHRNPVSEKTRRLQAAAKTGSRNPRSRAITATGPNGESRKFPCASDAAKFFGVSQQLFEQWMNGKVTWPGTGTRMSSPKNAWIASWRASYI